MHLDPWVVCILLSCLEQQPYLHLAATEIATFASGCFWGVEHIFLKHYPPAQGKGIIKTSVGYTGGKETSQNPGYRAVCSGETGHAEAVKIEFDPAIVKYDELVGASKTSIS